MYLLFDYICCVEFKNIKIMKELKIYEYQAKHIEDTLRLVARVLESESKETCLDRDVIQAWEMIKNVIVEEPNKITKRL